MSMHALPDDLLTAYEGLHTLSCRMLEAAIANDWDRLAAIERKQAELRLHLSRLSATTPPSAENAPRLAQLMRQTLDNDAEIRRHVEPWMDSARKLLAAGRRGRAMRAAYNATGAR